MRWALATTLLLAGCGSTVYASCGLWQLGTLIGDVVEAPQEAPARSPARVEASTPREVAPVLGASALPPPPLSADPAPLFPAPPESGRDVSEASEKAVSLVVETDEPDQPAPCEDIYVYIVSVAEGDPRQSAASLSVGKTSPARFRQPGNSIGEWEVVSIHDDWSGVNPDVWLRKGTSLCRAELAGNPARVHVPLKPPPAKKKRAPRRRKRR